MTFFSFFFAQFEGGSKTKSTSLARIAFKTSVCNKWNQTWDVKNLYLCDGAPFPSNADKNPTLSIMALAWRAGDYLAEEARKGTL